MFIFSFWNLSFWFLSFLLMFLLITFNFDLFPYIYIFGGFYFAIIYLMALPFLFGFLLALTLSSLCWGRVQLKFSVWYYVILVALICSRRDTKCYSDAEVDIVTITTSTRLPQRALRHPVEMYKYPPGVLVVCRFGHQMPE